MCFQCGMRGHWASECTSTVTLSDEVHLHWCVTDIELLDSSTPSPMPVWRPVEAASCGLDAEKKRNEKFTKSPEAASTLKRLLTKEFGHPSFRSFQLPIVLAILQVLQRSNFIELVHALQTHTREIHWTCVTCCIATISLWLVS